MKLKYINEHFNIDNKVSSINEILMEINTRLENKDIAFSHLTIDGIEIYENHEEYIKQNLSEIIEIEIVTRNVKEMIWGTMESIRSYLQGAIPAISELVDEGYNNFSHKFWEGINQLAEGMQWILQFVSVAKDAPQQPANWNELERSIQQCEASFVQLLEAVEVKDTILISDILSYEVTPAYESLKEGLAETLKDEEYLKNVN